MKLTEPKEANSLTLFVFFNNLLLYVFSFLLLLFFFTENMWIRCAEIDMDYFLWLFKLNSSFYLTHMVTQFK